MDIKDVFNISRFQAFYEKLERCIKDTSWIISSIEYELPFGDLDMYYPIYFTIEPDEYKTRGTVHFYMTKDGEILSDKIHGDLDVITVLDYIK